MLPCQLAALVLDDFELDGSLRVGAISLKIEQD